VNERDEMTEALKRMAQQMTDQLKATPPIGGGRLVSPQVESALRRSITMKSQFAVLSDDIVAKWAAEAAARPWHAKIKFRIIRWRNEWSWRLSKAWAHLRGIECEQDDW
jgi:hypothetical protein